MKKIIVPLLFIVATNLFAQTNDRFVMFGGDFGLAGNAGANISGGLEAANGLYLCAGIDFLAAFPVSTSPQSFMLSVGALDFPLENVGSGMLLAIDAGFADYVVATNTGDNWCYATDGVVAYNFGGVIVGLKGALYISNSVQASLSIILDLGGPLSSAPEHPTDSASSAPKSSGVAPLSPVLEVGDSSDGSVTLQWYASYGAETYNLYRDGTLIYSGPLTFFVDTGLVPSSKHFYTITARNSAGVSGQSEAVSGIASKPKAAALAPLAPFLSITDASASSLTLQWNASYGADTYHLYRNGNAVYSGPLTYFVDTGLVSGVKYFYTITAENVEGVSGQSDSVSARVPEPKARAQAQQLPTVQALSEPTVSSIQQASEWVNAHIAYDWAKARNDDYYLLSPSQVLAARSGVCRDMVVLTLRIVYDSLKIKANYVGIKIPGTPGHAIIEFNGKYFDPTGLATYRQPDVSQVMSYDEVMTYISKQLKY